MGAQEESGQSRAYEAVFVAAAALGLGYICWRVLLPFFGGIAWAIVLAVAFWGPWRMVERRLRRRRSLAAALFTLALALVVLLPAAFFVGLLANQANDAASHVVALLRAQKVSSFSDLIALPAVGHLLDGIRAQIGISQAEFQKMAEGFASNASAFIGAISGKLLLSAFDAVVTFVVALFVLFFLFRDGRRIGAAVLELLPMDEPGRAGLSASLRNMLVAIFRGTLLCALVQGVIGGTGWWIAGLPNPALAGAAMAVFSLLPVGGTAIVWLPGSIWAWTQGRHGAAIFFLLWGFLAVSLFTDSVLRPLLVRGSEELSTLVVIFGVFGGLPAFGLLGIFLGPIALVLAINLLAAVRRRVNPPAADIAGSPAGAAVSSAAAASAAASSPAGPGRGRGGAPAFGGGKARPGCPTSSPLPAGSPIRARAARRSALWPRSCGASPRERSKRRSPSSPVSCARGASAWGRPPSPPPARARRLRRRL